MDTTTPIVEYYEQTLESRITSRDVIDLNRLLPQLTSHAKPTSLASLKEILESGTRLFVAAANDHIVGTVSLCSTLSPTGRKDWIEDVVVDEAFRGQGIFGQLMDMAEEASRTGGAKSINLTSKLDRIEARAGYLKRGYVLRDTDVFRLDWRQ